MLHDNSGDMQQQQESCPQCRELVSLLAGERELADARVVVE